MSVLPFKIARVVATPGPPSGAPDQMAAPTVAQASSSALTVTFTPAVGADTHEERHAPMIPQVGGDIATGWWSAAAAITSGSTISSLDPKIQYQVQTRGINTNGAGLWSPTGTGTTATTVANNSDFTTYTTTGDAYIDGLLSGSNWTFSGSPKILTYSFPQNGIHYAGLGGFYGNNEHLIGFAGMNTAQANYVRRMLFYYQQVHLIKYVELAEDNANPAVMRYAITAQGGTHAYYPISSQEGGDARMTSSTVDYSAPGNFSCKAVIHETGHAHGFKHPHLQVSSHTIDRGRIMPNGTGDSFDRDYGDWTVMSYRSYPGHGGIPFSGVYANEAFGYAQSLMRLDILALQTLYGARTDHTGVRVHTWSPTTGAYSVNGVLQWTPGANRIYQTVWDGGTSDDYSFLTSGYTQGSITANLTPGSGTITASGQRADCGGGYFAADNIFNAFNSSIDQAET